MAASSAASISTPKPVDKKLHMASSKKVAITLLVIALLGGIAFIAYVGHKGISDHLLDFGSGLGGCVVLAFALSYLIVKKPREIKKLPEKKQGARAHKAFIDKLRKEFYGQKMSSYNRYDKVYDASCDGFNVFPSEGCRLKLRDGRSTNGARINEGMILIQAPFSDDQMERMKKIIEEQECRGLVRLGAIEKGYKPYYKLEGMKIPQYVLEEWEDGNTIPVSNLHEFILGIYEMRKNELLLVHCKAGAGRSGVFAICYDIYKKCRESYDSDAVIEIDPEHSLYDLREKRSECVRTFAQFKMILDYIEHLSHLGFKVTLSENCL